MFNKKFISLLLIFSLCFLIGFTSFNNLFVMAKTTKEKGGSYSAKALYLMDYNTNQVLFEQNSEQKIPVASIVKLMTICLTCEEIDAGNLNIDDLITVSENASSMGGSQVFIESNGQYSVGDLLKSTIVSSANDASVALAEAISGSEEEFVVLMNKKAKELGMTNTNYVNCTGLPASNQFSCAKDTATILKEVTKHDVYHKYSTIWMDKLLHPKGRESELVNTNKLIRYYEGCDGGKTGSTSEAGYCLVATAKRGNMRLIGVVLGAENGKARFAETSKLLNYGFSNFENKMVVDNTIALNEKANISSGKISNVAVKAKDSLFVICKKREDNGNEIETKVKMNNQITAPVKKGEKVGEIYVIKNGEIIAQTDIICIEDVAKSNMLDNFNKAIDNWKIA